MQDRRLRILRQNQVRNVTADLEDVYNDVAVEPSIRPLSRECFEKLGANIDDCARADLSARGVWRDGESALFTYRFSTQTPRPKAIKYSSLN